MESYEVEELLKDPLGTEYLREHLTTTTNSEYLFFYTKVEELHNNDDNDEEVKKLANKIYKLFFQEKSTFYIQFTQELISTIMEDIEEDIFTSFMYDDAQEYVVEFITNNCIQSFLESDSYNEYKTRKENDPNLEKKFATLEQAICISERNSNTLNDIYPCNYKPRKPLIVMNDLLTSLITILKLNFSINLKKINFEKIKKSFSYQKFTKATSELQKVDLNLLKGNEIFTFFINLYNLLYIHIIIEDQAFVNIKTIKTRNYIVNGFEFKLDDILNGILRSNQKANGKNYFSENDLRKQFSTENVDPRIHFALLNFQYGISLIKKYEPQTIDEELKEMAKIQLNTMLIVKKNAIYLPLDTNIFLNDFGQNNQQIMENLSELSKNEVFLKMKKNEIKKIQFFKNQMIFSQLSLHFNYNIFTSQK
ncbi:electron carrier/ protein disulfide oxidoreductase [Anaeramoeba flamelloides]|uniref:Electron carrier/ protein disulfide oxidoreductase n=1 Tax=Anaeramoeba flamelloides TaxID=1746091 RepID=A0AAV7YPS6_9EUKA|nr:electron carrier/ protein disulfide oxidoreductase [Anaeramoeba flamelloides]